MKNVFSFILFAMLFAACGLSYAAPPPDDGNKTFIEQCAFGHQDTQVFSCNLVTVPAYPPDIWRAESVDAYKENSKEATAKASNAPPNFSWCGSFGAAYKCSNAPVTTRKLMCASV